MNISVNLLKDYVGFDIPLSGLVDTLNNIGLLVEDFSEVEDDIILDVETYANRPDTLGHLGIARELSVKLDIPLNKRDWPLTEIEQSTENLIDVQIWDEDLCPRYSGIIVRNLNIGPSPPWLQKFIRAMGLNPVNNVVDVSNYVLFATAQPIHTFDLAKLAGAKIVIRKAKKGETLKSLDGSLLQLESSMLVIADEEKPVALAGVIGGEESAVSPSTTDIFIESAYFDPVSIRKTGKASGMKTDASYRFERGADISFPPTAALMAASLLSDIGGRVTKGLIDVYPLPRKPKTIVLRHHRIKELLGLDVDQDFISKTLAALEFHVEQEQSQIWQLKAPSFRVDIEREADVIEEIARFYGYDKIPSWFPPLNAPEPAMGHTRGRIDELNHILYHHGFDEVVNFSFISPERESLLKSGLDPVEIRNPISARASLLRTNLVGGMLENVAWNLNRGADGVHIFEVGKVFFSRSESFTECLNLSIMTSGFRGSEQWNNKRRRTDFFVLKGVCESLMDKMGYFPYAFKDAGCSCFEEDQSLALFYKNQKIGSLGMIRRDILEDYSIKGDVWAAELDLGKLFEKQHKAYAYSPVGRFPSVDRDISFIGDEGVKYQEIRNAIEKIANPYLEEYSLLDRFKGKPIPRGKVSLSFRFVFRHPKKTLQAEEVDTFQHQIMGVLKSRFNFQLREGD